MLEAALMCGEVLVTYRAIFPDPAGNAQCAGTVVAGPQQSSFVAVSAHPLNQHLYELGGDSTSLLSPGQRKLLEADDAAAIKCR